MLSTTARVRVHISTVQALNAVFGACAPYHELLTVHSQDDGHLADFTLLKRLKAFSQQIRQFLDLLLLHLRHWPVLLHTARDAFRRQQCYL